MINKSGTDFGFRIPNSIITWHTVCMSKEPTGLAECIDEITWFEQILEIFKTLWKGYIRRFPSSFFLKRLNSTNFKYFFTRFHRRAVFSEFRRFFWYTYNITILKILLFSSLTLILPGLGAWEAHFTLVFFCCKKSTHFAVYFTVQLLLAYDDSSWRKTATASTSTFIFRILSGLEHTCAQSNKPK